MKDEDRRAQRLIDDLDQPNRASTMLEHPEYRTLQFCLLYLEHCEDLCRRDPRAALPAAKIATALAQRVSKKDCKSVGGWCSLQVRALAVNVDVQRSAADFAGAEATLQVARFLFVGDADDLAQGELLRQLARLRRDQQRFEEAERHAGQAIRIFKHLAEHHLWGCTLVDRGLVSICTNQPWKAAGDLFEALSLIDQERSPSFYYAAAHNLALALADDSESNPAEALYWLRYAQRINEQPESSLSQLKLLWAEGRILEKQGMLSEAEHFLQTVRIRLRELRTLGDYALASLDLAGIYLKQSRTREVRTLAGELFPIFHHLRGDPDALDALKRFHRAAIAEALSLEVLRSIKVILRALTRPTI